MSRPSPSRRPQVAFMVTCLVDLFRPSVALASLRLLEEAGCDVVVPDGQTCCGQPTYNGGDVESARKLARRVIDALSAYEYVVLPSSSCAGMLRVHYPRLFDEEPAWRSRAEALSSKVYELSAFLIDVLDAQLPAVSSSAAIAYHDSCSARSELGVVRQPRALLARAGIASLCTVADAETCCGFGGTFAVQFPEISGRLVDDKASQIEASGADTLLGGDLSCLMNIAGRLRRRGSAIRVYHLAEVLAGLTDGPGIGEGKSS